MDYRAIVTNYVICNNENHFMSINTVNDTTISQKINEWCEVLEDKAKNQTYGRQVMFFWFSIGKLYYKIVRSDNDTKSDTVHAFVNKSNGDIYKPASWQAPYKQVRYNIVTEFDKLLNDCEWTGDICISDEI